MVDSPDKIKKSIDNNTYEIQDYDVSVRIRAAMTEGFHHININYFLCNTLKEELKNKGYKIEESQSWFFGDTTVIRW